MSTKSYRTTPNMRGNVITEKIYELAAYHDCDLDNSLNAQRLINIVTSLSGCEWAYILHDLDTNEEGEIKKDHTHILIRFARARSIKTLADELGVSQNAIKWKSDWRGSVQYLIHFNHPNKHLYDISDITANFNLHPFFEPLKGDESAQVSLIVNYAISQEINNKYDLMAYCIDNQLWSSYRRNYSIIWDILYDFQNVRKGRESVKNET